MRYQRSKRNRAVRRANSIRRNRSSRRLFLESLERRVVLSATPTLMDLDSSSGSEPGNVPSVGDATPFVAAAAGTFSDAAGSSSLDWSLGAEGEGATNTSRLTIFVDGQQVAIPADIGVTSGGTMESVFTDDTSGELRSDMNSTVTLGDFFDTWRTNAGLAGNNPDAVLSDMQLLDNVEDGANTVQMFVNGELSEEFDDYVLQDGDEIILVYGDDPVVALNTNFGSIVIELFETATPGTVANFLNYVNDGDYINSFFHRSADSSGQDFVIQGGGFVTDSTTYTSTGQFTSVPTDAPIQNEPGISNLRGTVAMAKTSNPDSATSQFFVNLNDANTFLDSPSNSGGFTVFGQVLDMTSSDEIAALPIRTEGSPYNELPVGPNDQLVVIQEIQGQGEISGVKFADDNANGVRDAGEAGIAGVSIFLDANNNGVLDAGEVSTTTDSDGQYFLQVPAGTYTVRADVSAGKVATVPVSPDSYSVTVEIGREAAGRDFGEANLPAPTGVDLLSGFDTGTSTTDNLTRFNNDGAANELQFSVTGVMPGAVVTVFSDGVAIGTATAASNTVTVVTDGANVLADGPRIITARQSTAGVDSAASASLTVTIDTAAPSAIASTAPDQTQAGQAYTFDADSPSEGQAGISYGLTGAPSGMSINASTGVVDWTPTAQQAVPQQFSIDVIDGAGNTVSQLVDLTVLGVIPAFPDSYSVDEEMDLTVDAANGVLDNDVDDIGTLTASLVSQPANGTVSFNSDGSFTYSPNSDFFGEDSFTYQTTDGVDDSNVAKVTIDVANVNDAVVPAADSYTTSEDVILEVAVDAGVLANDQDADGDTLTATIAVLPANGSVSLAADGAFIYTPDAEFHGSDSFTYTVSDGTVTSDPVTVNLTITEVADAPTAVDDTYSVSEDDTLSVTQANGVLANDSDPDSTVFTANITTQPANGTVTLNSNGSFTYTPDPDFFGSDSFTYKATDGVNVSEDATVTITVNAEADIPTANDDTATAVSDAGAVLIDVLANDSSIPDGNQALAISNITQGISGGSVSISGSQISYTPSAGFVGTDSFTYTIQDSDGLNDTATVTVTVSEPPNNLISGFVYIDSNHDGMRGSEEVGVPGSQINLTGTSLDGGSITRAVLTDDDGFYEFAELPAGTYQVSQRQPMGISDGDDTTTIPDAVSENDVITGISLSGGQSFTDNNFGEASLLPEFVSLTWFFASAGTPEVQFRETIAMAEEMAGNSNLAATIRSGGTEVPAADNFSPVGLADDYSVAENGTLTVTAASGVLDNDTDADGDSLTATLLTSTTSGSLTFNADGSFDYVPNTDFAGTDSFTYEANDGTNASNTVTVTITVEGVNVAPTASDDTYAASKNTVLTIAASNGVLDNDTDGNGDSLTATLVNNASNGTVVLSNDGSFTYTPTTDFVGSDSFTYQAGDGSAQSATATVTITVSDTATANTFLVAENSPAGTVVGTLDPETDLGSLVAFELEDPNVNDLLKVNADDHISGNPAGSVVLVEYVDFQCPVCATFHPIVAQLKTDFADELVVITRHFPLDNVHPLARDAAAAAEAAGRQGEFDAYADLLFDNQGDWDSLSDPQPIFEGFATDLGLDLTQFRADQGETSVADRVQRDVDDVLTLGGTGTPTFFLNGQFIANPASLTAFSALIQTEVDATNDIFEVDRETGEIIVRDSSSLDFESTPSFTLTVNAFGLDGAATSIAATINLSNVNDVEPVAVAETFDVNEDTVLSVNAANGVLQNDTDGDGDPLTAELLSSTTDGTLTFNTDGSFSYTPDAEFSGTDTFTYRVDDGQFTSTAATATITVAAVNDAPTTSADTYAVDEDGTLTIDAASGVLANDSDADGDSVTSAVVTGPTDGTLTLNADGSFTYTPDADFSGTDTFTYAASDGSLSTNETVTLTVNPVADAPVAATRSYGVVTGTPLAIGQEAGVLTNDTDPDGDALTAVLVAGPSNGDVTLNADGSFTYTPDTNFMGMDAFTYRASDGALQSEVTTIDLEVSEADLIGFRLETTQPDGTVISEVTEGESFILNVYAADLRSVPEGVFAGYLDLNYDPSLVSVDGAIVHESPLNNGTTGDTSVAGVIDELGAFSGQISPPGVAELLLARITFQADAVGTFTFTTDPADLLPTNASGLYGVDNDVEPGQIDYGSISLEVTAQGAGEGEGEAGGQAAFAAQADQLFAAEDDWLSSDRSM